VLWFSHDLKALGTVDFWIGDIGIFLQGTLLVYVFNLGLGADRGWQEAHRGAEIGIPSVFRPVIRWVTPTYLTAILAMFLLTNLAGWNLSFSDPAFAPTGPVVDLIGSPTSPASPVARLVVLFLAAFVALAALLIHLAGRRWSRAR
jgi:hypothetical protein